MIDHFNEKMKEAGSIIRLRFSPHVQGTVDIVLKQDDFIKSFIINPDDKFYEVLEKFFEEKYGIRKLSYNNTKTSFWGYE